MELVQSSGLLIADDLVDVLKKVDENVVDFETKGVVPVLDFCDVEPYPLLRLSNWLEEMQDLRRDFLHLLVEDKVERASNVLERQKDLHGDAFVRTHNAVLFLTLFLQFEPYGLVLHE